MRNIITVETLSKAIVNSSKYEGIPMEEAMELANHVLNFFGYSDRIIDNVLEPQDRDTFYMLEDASILTTEREETTLYDGREWRINYWLFRHDKVRKLVNGYEEKMAQAPPEETVYDTLPADIWERADE